MRKTLFRDLTDCLILAFAGYVLGAVLLTLLFGGRASGEEPPAAWSPDPPVAWTPPKKEEKKDSPLPGYHWEKDNAGSWWQVKDGYRLAAAPAVAAPRPFSPAVVITPGTRAPFAGGASSSSPAGTGTAHTPTFVLSTGLRGVTNGCPPSG